MLLVASLMTALLLDLCLGEPRRFHPLNGFGRLVTCLENRWYGGPSLSARQRIWRGTLALALAVVPFLLLAWWLEWVLTGFIGWLFATTILYLAVGHASLRSHARSVAAALQEHRVADAQAAVAHLVSRSTEDMDETAVSVATIESVLENGNDAVFASLFWFAAAGVPGVVVHRLANTLDAIWGYQNIRYLYFGRAAARLDDWLNWIPARLTATSYALCGSTARAWHCWRRQGGEWKSPNAGPVMAAGAGALQLRLGGSARYWGEIRQRPLLGCGAAPVAGDIDRTLHLLVKALLLWVAVIAVGEFGWFLCRSLPVG